NLKPRLKQRVEFVDFDLCPARIGVDLEVVGGLEINREPGWTGEVGKRAGQNLDWNLDTVESKVCREYRPSAAVWFKRKHASNPPSGEHTVNADIGSHIHECVSRPQEASNKGKFRFVVPYREPGAGKVAPGWTPKPLSPGQLDDRAGVRKLAP